MISAQYKLDETSIFRPIITAASKDLVSFAKYLRPNDDVHVELKNLNQAEKAFILAVLCGYHRMYPNQQVEIKIGKKFCKLISVPPLELIHKPRFFLNLQLTSRCNFSCKHCYNQLKNKHLKNPDLSLKAIEKICRQFLAVERARDFVDISVYLLGGEPFLHPDLPEIITMLSRIKVNGLNFNYIALGSNGLLVPKNIDLLKRARDLFESFRYGISGCF